MLARIWVACLCFVDSQDAVLGVSCSDERESPAVRTGSLRPAFGPDLPPHLPIAVEGVKCKRSISVDYKYARRRL